MRPGGATIQRVIRRCQYQRVRARGPPPRPRRLDRPAGAALQVCPWTEVLDKLLVSLFGVPPLGQKRNDRDYPALPTLLSLIDTAIDREHDLGNDWPTQKLR